ncbi:MAG: 4-alpha-glucanotransferase [Actinomycetota bacterium]|nr:4-alpha-glucanotransferase [Actinomycetota bacterium]
MSSSPDSPETWGISPGYHDVSGHWHETPPETGAALLEAMRTDEPVPVDPAWVLRPGEERPIPEGPWELITEGGARTPAGDRLPRDLPLGYHWLEHVDGGRRRLVVVSPGRCHLPAGLRTWGWAVQLYALRSGGSWGIGDLADLRRLGHWSKGLGAGMALLNPLHATLPTTPQPSPYYPSSRCFRNPIYVRVEEVPGAGGAGVDLERLAAEGRTLNADRIIDRSRVWKLKLAALEPIFERFRRAGGDPAFERFVAAGGEPLAGYAVHCALDEALDGTWPTWPSVYRRPDSPEVARFAAEHAERVRFHQWLQWCTELQLEVAGDAIDLVADMAIGTDPAGADAWLWQDTLALDVRVGAPPDDFNRKGQDWALPPFVPHRLRAAAYEPFILMLRAGFRGAGGMRFDHVMGLFRLYWIPAGATPAQGAYVLYPHDDLLDILALESHRAGAWVVGEDLGTVEDRVRQELAERDVLSYRVMWFEPEPPRGFPEKALAAVTTHDLPTVAGLWTGADLAEQRKLGLEPNEEGQEAIRVRLAELAGLPDDAPAADAVVAAYRLLAGAPSMVLAATLEDALVVEERPNVPGTVDERPNWSVALPVPQEELERSETARAIAAGLNRG